MFVQSLNTYDPVKWSQGTIADRCSDRSYIVEIEGRLLRRNRRYLRNDATPTAKNATATANNATPAEQRGDSENNSTARRMEPIPRNGQNTAEPIVRTPNVNLIDGIIHNQTKCGVSFAHLNVRSIVNKLDQFRILLSKKPFDVICVNETFCDGSISDSEINLPDYSIIRRDRNRHGGGVAMYIRNSLTFIRRNDLETDDIESIWIEMKCKQRQPVIIGSIYRPPSSPIDFIDKLGDIIDNISCECKETIVTGDFNYDVSGDDSSGASNPVISCFNLFQMLQLIHDPTRVSEFTNSTIDLIFTSHPELVSESGVLPVLISDHYLVYGVHCWKAPKREGRSINFRCFKDIDNDDFRDDIINAPWEHVLKNLFNPEFLRA